MGNWLLMETIGRVGKGLVKGWQSVGKMHFLFHRLSMLYQCFINAAYRRNSQLSIYPRLETQHSRRMIFNSTEKALSEMKEKWHDRVNF